MGTIAIVVATRRPASAPETATTSLSRGSDGGSADTVDISGCSAVREERAGDATSVLCEVGADRTVRVGASSRFARFFAVAGAPSPVTTVLRELPASDGGAVFNVEVPAGLTELRVVAGAGADRLFRLGTKSAPEWLDRAKAARQKGDTAGALAIAAEHEKSTTPVDRAFAIGIQARIELAAGHPDIAFPLLRESAKIHRGAGRLSDAADDSFALAFALNQRSHHYGEARRVLDDVRSWVAPYADGRARESYYRGQLAAETGDARAAFALLREARVRAARLGLGVLERNATNAYALELEQVGRRAEAKEVLRALALDLASAKDAAPCEKVEVAINTSYGTLLDNEEAGEAARPVDPTTDLEAALALTAPDAGCKDRYLRSAVLGNLALAALQRGDVATARKHLAGARDGTSEARAIEVMFWHDLEGRIALADKDGARASAAFDEENRLAESLLSFEGQWRARVGRGAALELLGKNDDALARYREAEDLLTTLSFLVPLGEGRGTFVGDRSRSARLAVDVLARTGRAAEALAIARVSRARVIAGLARTARVQGLAEADRSKWEATLGTYRDTRAKLDAEAKDDWKLTRPEALRARERREAREKELRVALEGAIALVARDMPKTPVGAALPSDALTIAFHPIRRGWLGLVFDGATASSFAVPELPKSDEQAAAMLLEPIRSSIAKATRLRVLAYGPLRSIDFHALSFEGAPLVERVPVEYPLDLPRAPRTASAERDRIALVVADPTLDLDKTRAEADVVTGALRDGGAFRVQVLAGREATSANVISALAEATHLHYAGHGVFAGLEGWESALPLAGGGHLAVSDVLATRAVPAHVVLSGCETARAGSEAPLESLGLAQAFVIAGSDFVIAPVRRVDDAAAAKTTAALYVDGAPADAAKALRAAQITRRREAPESDWAAFRVVSR